MSVLTDAVARAFPRYLQQLADDSSAFTDALVVVGQTEGGGQDAGRATPEMIAALSQWNQDAQAALSAFQGLSPRARGRGSAIQAMQALVSGLSLLDHALSLPDLAAAMQASTQARQQLDAYHQLADHLDRTFP